MCVCVCLEKLYSLMYILDCVSYTDIVDKLWNVMYIAIIYERIIKIQIVSPMDSFDA